jgi:DNA-binding IscR family transcriptional regulator
MDTELERVHDEEEADARRAIVRILNRAPYDVWTRDSLARSVGVPASLTERILIQLTRSGIVQRLDDSDEIEYTVATDAY